MIIRSYDTWKLAGPPEGPDYDLLYEAWVAECYNDHLLEEVVRDIEPDLFYRPGGGPPDPFLSEARIALRERVAEMFRDRRTGAIDRDLLVAVAAELDAARGPAHGLERTTPTFERWLESRGRVQE